MCIQLGIQQGSKYLDAEIFAHQRKCLLRMALVCLLSTLVKKELVSLYALFLGQIYLHMQYSYAVSETFSLNLLDLCKTLSTEPA